jgi:hypothetical protein
MLTRAGIGSQTRWVPRIAVTEAEQPREETQAEEWSFRASFERACADAAAIFADDAMPHRGFLIIGLRDGPVVATPFYWNSNAEKARLYDRLSRRYQGRADFYIHATESTASASGDGSRIVRVFGSDRRGVTLARCLDIRSGSVVEYADSPRTHKPLPEVLFAPYGRAP